MEAKIQIKFFILFKETLTASKTTHFLTMSGRGGSNGKEWQLKLVRILKIACLVPPQA